VPIGSLYEEPFNQFNDGGPDVLFGHDTDSILKFVETTNRLVLPENGGRYA
jgi:hypothetical protein